MLQREHDQHRMKARAEQQSKAHLCRIVRAFVNAKIQIKSEGKRA